MSDTITLRVAGHDYTGNPAGTGGDTYQAGTSGSEADLVWYKIPHGGGIGGAIGSKFWDRVKSAYLDASARSAIDSVGVLYKTEKEVEGAGMSNYVLWLVKDGKK
ncbi:MAG: hypothetical protein HY744_02225 [Deltaproteobacteria bacterium]|nr:hypothetical protein [Deltaproteobacteria bacterium]